MLLLKPNCECCGRDLPPDAADARICSFECTFLRPMRLRGVPRHLPELRRWLPAAPDPAGGAARPVPDIGGASFARAALRRPGRLAPVAHRHVATVSWSRGDAVFSDRRYSRAHRWIFDGGAEVHASASPFIVRTPLSDPSGVDPEEAFVAAASSWPHAVLSRLCGPGGLRRRQLRGCRVRDDGAERGRPAIR